MLKSLFSLTVGAILAGAAAVPAAAEPSSLQAAQTELAAAIHGYQASLLHHGLAPLAPGKIGVPEDWSHHHLMFSKPQPGSEAERRVQADIRYWQQRVHRALQAARAANTEAVGTWGGPPAKKNNGLWEYNLGTGAAVGAGMYPAKYSFAVSSATCDTYSSGTHTIGDFVVFNTGGEDTAASIGAQGSSAQPTIVAFSNLYSSCPTATNPAGRNPIVAWAYNSGSEYAATSPVLSIDGTKVAFVETGTTSGATLRILKPYVPATGSQGYYSHTTSANVTVTSGSKTVTSTSNDFAATDVGQIISGTDISSGTTITAYTSPTSVTISANASATNKAAVILGGTTANVWTVGTIGNTTATTWGSGTTCTATQSCMISVAFNGSRADLYSAPFYDYDTDTIYVGDSGGYLHKFTGVFNGTPAEVTTTWPVQPVTGVASSPVYDANTGSIHGSGNIYMGDHSGNESATPNSCSSSTCYTRVTSGHLPISYSAATDGIFDPPLVDSTNKTAVWFAAGTSTASATSTASTCAGSTTRAISGVDQTTSTMASNQTVYFCGDGARLSYAGAARAGTFDNEYFTSVSSGHLWFCSLLGSTTDLFHWSLYNIGFSSLDVMSSSTANGPLDMTSSSVSPNECTPVTEFLNGTTDEFYVGLQENGTLTGCSGSTTVSCLYLFTSNSTDTSTFPTTATAELALPAVSTAPGGNFSGIIIDNSSSTTGAAQVYFTPLADQTCSISGGTGGCAYQASQSALQ
jgi:hypothetical protein